MAPPENTFPLSELETRVHVKSTNLKEKSRKLPRDFDLKRDCELFELVQYSCTTMDEMETKVLSGVGTGRMECFPFVRLFRRCGEGEQMFHVETTAWEGRHAYKPKRLLEEKEDKSLQKEVKTSGSNNESSFATYGSYFWSNK